MIKPAFPDGHFYSPTVDPDELARDRARIWPENPELPGIDLNLEAMAAFIDGPLRKYTPDFDYPLERPTDRDESHYYEKNSQFGFLDSRALFAMLRDRKPGRMIEVGSGYSSLITADVNRRFLNKSIDFHCIEPFPRQFLKDGVEGITQVLVAKVQDVPVDYFMQLQAGDVLFIDSSHVSKTGSDVNFLYFEVLPRLVSGVLVQVHDIFLPHDYGQNWVLDDQRSWNEQYVLQALLTHTSAFQVLFGSSAAVHYHHDLLLEVVGPEHLAGGSFWFERV